MMPKPESTSGTLSKELLIGIDWADSEHAVCLLTSDENPLHETVAQEPEAIAEWVTGLTRRFPGWRLQISLEQSRGALIYALMGFTEIQLYPVNPRQLASYRDAVFPSGAKDDPGDAELLARFLKHHRDQLRPWQPDSPETRRIAELVELRRKLVEERKRVVLQLTSSLKLYFPLVLALSGGSLFGELMLDLLLRWPTLEELKRVHPKTLRKFLAAHRLKNSDQQTEFINQVRSAVPLTKDRSLVEPRAKYVQALARQIQDLNQGIGVFDEELARVVVMHPDEKLFRSLPGAGDALVPRLIAAFGSDRERYESAEQMQAYSGIAPVTRRSGKSKSVVKRHACPKFLRQTFHEFADHARKWSRWSKAFYQMKRAAGVKHHAAVRALAYKWIRIIFRLWKTSTTYSETRYIEQLKAKNSPVIQFLETT